MLARSRAEPSPESDRCCERTSRCGGPRHRRPAGVWTSHWSGIEPQRPWRRGPGHPPALAGLPPATSFLASSVSMRSFRRALARGIGESATDLGLARRSRPSGAGARNLQRRDPGPRPSRRRSAPTRGRAHRWASAAFARLTRESEGHSKRAAEAGSVGLHWSESESPLQSSQRLVLAGKAPGNAHSLCASRGFRQRRQCAQGAGRRRRTCDGLG